MNEFKIAIVGDLILTEFIISTAMKQVVNASTSEILVVCNDNERLKYFRESYNVSTTDNLGMISKTSVVVFAIQDTQIISKIRETINPESIIINIANITKLKMSELEKIFPTQAIVSISITSSIINGTGITAYLVGKNRKRDAENFAVSFFSQVSQVMKVETDEELNTIYEIFFAQMTSAILAIKSMINSAVDAGISPERARKITDIIVRGQLEIELQPDDVIKELRSKLLAGQGSTIFFEEGISLIHKYGMWNFLRI